MAYLTESFVRQRATASARRRGISVEDALRRAARTEMEHYDVFLSQTIKDRGLVYGVYVILTEDHGLTVFCDWIDAPAADRSNVTPENARYVREMMKRSESLLFLDTLNADQSKWMCWELGWFDGAKGKVGILPIVKNETDQYRGREFLGLYPVVEVDDVRKKLKVSESPEMLRLMMVPGRPYALATTFPFDAWRKATRNPMPGRGQSLSYRMGRIL